MKKTTLRAALIPALVLTAAAAAPEGADAQRTFRSVKDRFFEVANWSLEAGAGYGNISRLLLQDVGARQRELNPNGAFAWGVGASVTILERTQLRIAYTRVTGDLAYDDDTGDGGSVLDDDDLGDIGSSILTFEAGRYLFSDRAKVVPYARAGFAIAWWSLDDDEGEFIDNGTETRTGASGALGVQFRLHRRVALRLEAETYRVGNPFTGNESFIPTTGETIDEPGSVSSHTYRAVLSYNLGRPRPFDREER